VEKHLLNIFTSFFNVAEDQISIAKCRDNCNDCNNYLANSPVQPCSKSEIIVSFVDSQRLPLSSDDRVSAAHGWSLVTIVHRLDYIYLLYLQLGMDWVNLSKAFIIFEI
jgi:hypothetical protein